MFPSLLLYIEEVKTQTRIGDPKHSEQSLIDNIWRGLPSETRRAFSLLGVKMTKSNMKDLLKRCETSHEESLYPSERDRYREENNREWKGFDHAMKSEKDYQRQKLSRYNNHGYKSHVPRNQRYYNGLSTKFPRTYNNQTSTPTQVRGNYGYNNYNNKINDERQSSYQTHNKMQFSYPNFNYRGNPRNFNSNYNIRHPMSVNNTTSAGTSSWRNRKNNYNQTQYNNKRFRTRQIQRNPNEIPIGSQATKPNMQSVNMMTGNVFQKNIQLQNFGRCFTPKVNQLCPQKLTYPLTTLKIKINGESVETLIDSGANISLMKKSFAEKLKLAITRVNNQFLTAVNEQTQPIYGYLDFLTYVNDTEIQLQVVVSENSSMDLLLGTNFLVETKTIIEAHTGKFFQYDINNERQEVKENQIKFSALPKFAESLSMGKITIKNPRSSEGFNNYIQDFKLRNSKS